MVDKEVLIGGPLYGDGNAVPMPRPENQGTEDEHVEGALKELHG